MTRKERQQRQPVIERAEIGQELLAGTAHITAIAKVLAEQNPEARKPEPSPSVELLLKALRIAGSTRKLAEWIQTPVPALNGETPYALMQSEEGRKQVDAILSRIEHGVY